MSTAIEARGLGKRYRLQRIESAGLGGARQRDGADDELWAVRDAGFTVHEGEAIGIIGRNGAGKSTLMKILSRIVEPTTGAARIRGRIACLLEVGTGFHPELTGRENIHLNGAILGMRRKDIARRLDEIVEFAGVSRFLDMAVKHYSSGMYLRLAFAVAAHLEAEILIADEVLAVGDFAFQKKCLGMMERVAGRGRTVLLVSHNLAAIAQLTQRTLLMDQGRIAFDGATADAIRRYTEIKEKDSTLQHRRPVEQIARDRSFRATDELIVREMGLAPGQAAEIPVGGTVRLEFLIQARARYEGVRVAYTISSLTGEPRLTGLSPPLALEAGTQLLELTLDALDLVPGDYTFSVNLGHGGWNEPKQENDSYMGFGRLTITDTLLNGQRFGAWESQWGPVLHRSSRWRPLS